MLKRSGSYSDSGNVIQNTDGETRIDVYPIRVASIRVNVHLPGSNATSEIVSGVMGVMMARPSRRFQAKAWADQP